MCNNDAFNAFVRKYQTRKIDVGVIVKLEMKRRAVTLTKLN